MKLQLENLKINRRFDLADAFILYNGCITLSRVGDGHFCLELTDKNIEDIINVIAVDIADRAVKLTCNVSHTAIINSIRREE